VEVANNDKFDVFKGMVDSWIADVGLEPGHDDAVSNKSDLPLD
jgi:hypothetical protein